MWAVSAAVGVLLLTLWLIWRKKNFSVLKKMGIPGPEPSILFGNLWELSSKDSLECHKKWAKQYGRIFGYYFGAKPVIMVADADLLKKIQVSDFQKFVNRPAFFQVSGSSANQRDGFFHNITILRDKRWKEIRSIVTPSFTTSKMKTMTPIMNNAIETLIEKIDKKARGNEAFDIYSMFQGLTLDVIGRTAFGIQTEVQKNSNDPFLESVKALLSNDLGTFLLLAFSFPELATAWKYVRRLRLMLLNEGKNPVTEILDSVTNVIKTRRNDKSARRNDLLQLMIDAQMSESDLKNMKDKDLTAGGDEQKEEIEKSGGGTAANPTSKLLRQMTDREIVDNSVAFFIAGYETTSTALAFSTHLLIEHPEAQERIRKEVKDLVEKEGTLDYTSVHKLQYLDQFLRESLRMYPPVYLFVNREAGEDITFGNIRIKKGSVIQVPVYLLHYDPELWPEPKKFDPERFSPENKSSIHPMAWQPFGAGPRNCVGMRFAQMEAKLALASLLLKFRFVKTDKSEEGFLTLRIKQAAISPAKGVILKAIPI